jgi:hypothetical protein
MVREARQTVHGTVRVIVGVVLVLGAAAASHARQPPPDGWVVIPVDDYRALRTRAYPPTRPPDPPPVDAAITRVEYELRANGASAAGEARVTVDVLKEGWVRVDVPAGLMVRAARIGNRAIPIVQHPAPHVLLSKPGRVVITLDIVAPLTVRGGVETVTIPPSRGAVSRVAIVVPRPGIAVSASGGVLSERAQQPEDRWVALGRAGQPLVLSWQRRADDRAAAPLKWRGDVTTLVGLGEDASSVSASIDVEVTQGVAPYVDVEIPDGVTVNQVGGPLIADWDVTPGSRLRVNFLEPLAARTTFTLTGELRAPREGAVALPLVRLRSAEREAGGVAVEVLGAGEIAGRDPRGLEPADPSDLGAPVRGRESPSMLAFTYRAQPGTTPRSLTLAVARYTPEAVLIASIEEARYDVLIDEEGKTLVRARYAVRNNQRAFLAVQLPAGATLWSASVAGRALRPGLDQNGAVLLTLEKGRSGEDAPAFPVELTYVQRGEAWTDKGRGQLTLPSVDLPAARSGISLRYSPRFDIAPVAGAFRIDTDNGPFTPTLLDNPPRRAAERDDLPRGLALEELAGAAGGRLLSGPIPVAVTFPQFGRAVFLAAELTAELKAPVVDFTYKRDSRW